MLIIGLSLLFMGCVNLLLKNFNIVTLIQIGFGIPYICIGAKNIKSRIDWGIRWSEMYGMNAYHVVTDKPKYIEQQIIFDEEHHSGVFQKVQDKLNFVNDIYSNP